MFSGGAEDLSLNQRGLLAALLLTLLLALVSGCWVVSNIISYMEHPERHAHDAAERMLRVAGREPPGADVPRPYASVGAACWRVMQEAMQGSTGEYRISALPSTSAERGDSAYADEVFLEIDFADHGAVELVWYQRQMQGCEVRPDPEER
jgi:hypothetical protein